MSRIAVEKDIIGKRYGKLTVLERDIPRSGFGSTAYWICLCDCGKIKSIKKSDLMQKDKNKTCGCITFERRNKKFKKAA